MLNLTELSDVSISIDTIEMYDVELPMRSEWITSHSSQHVRQLVLIALRSGETVGWGECCATELPTYVEEYLAGERAVLRSRWIPELLEGQYPTVASLARGGLPHRNHFARSCVEMAMLDLVAQMHRQSLPQTLGITSTSTPAGVAVGIHPSIDSLLGEVSSYVDLGYRRVKAKVDRDCCVEVASAIRGAFPSLLLGLDANGVFEPSDTPALVTLDQLDLAFIEQPYGVHQPPEVLRELSNRISTPLCLDESLRSVADIEQWTANGMTVANLKPSRVGGITRMVDMAQRCRDLGLGAWIGGMVESGLGRTVNAALAELPGITMPGDLSGSDRFFVTDLLGNPPQVIDGQVLLSSELGLGYRIDPDSLARFTVQHESFDETGPNCPPLSPRQRRRTD